MMKPLRFPLALLLLSIYWSPVFGQTENRQLNTSKAYQFYPNRIVQGTFKAEALSESEIVSNYRSAAADFVNPYIDFKFSINGKDNEMASGIDHRFLCDGRSGRCETPLIIFGTQLKETRSAPASQSLAPDTKWNVRLDMRHVFKSFEQKGYFETFDGTRIYKEDFKGVYIAGATPPLTWDFDNLHNYTQLALEDPDGDHIFELTLTLNARETKKSTSPRWRESLDLTPYPQYHSPSVLMDAVYNLSLEEMIRAVEKDSTLRTGKEWAGVWTRDVSYSTILAMAILQPKVAKYSLMRKVKDGVIIQDTGTGGAYPISTDRVIWAVAAWEIYKVTGDTSWLAQSYPIIRKTLQQDLHNVYDSATGLVLGESSFLDWREQTYPDWMQPADIYESMCLGTNAVHYQANAVLSEMARLRGDTATVRRHNGVAERIKNGINNRLWQNDRSYYGQYLYGRTWPILSPKSEALGEALTVLFDIASAERKQKIIERTPVTDFGIPCIYPQIPGIPPYHNNAVWPFVQAFWTMAGAKAGNDASVMEGISAMIRPSALFLTNKENFVSEDGDFARTQINSDNMLWSLSGNIAVIYKVLFGVTYTPTALEFHPFVPKALDGKRVLTNYRYRNAVLDIQLEGYGNSIRHFFVNGRRQENATIPAGLEGRFHVRIVLGQNTNAGAINRVPHHISPIAPAVTLSGTTLKWSPVSGAVKYKVLRNGVLVSTTEKPQYRITDKDFSEYQVVAVDAKGFESFASEPVVSAPGQSVVHKELELAEDASTRSRNKGFSGNGYVVISTDSLREFRFHFTAPEDGIYVVDFRYANGSGPVNTENKCAMRTLEVNGAEIGTIVFPQRGTNEWSDWGFSNSVLIPMKKGQNEFRLQFKQQNENMNGLVNTAALDYVRVRLVTQR